jgi:hypothetical protein
LQARRVGLDDYRLAWHGDDEAQPGRFERGLVRASDAAEQKP